MPIIRIERKTTFQCSLCKKTTVVLEDEFPSMQRFPSGWIRVTIDRNCVDSKPTPLVQNDYCVDCVKSLSVMPLERPCQKD